MICTQVSHHGFKETVNHHREKEEKERFQARSVFFIRPFGRLYLTLNSVLYSWQKSVDLLFSGSWSRSVGNQRQKRILSANNASRGAPDSIYFGPLSPTLFMNCLFTFTFIRGLPCIPKDWIKADEAFLRHPTSGGIFMQI
jgi:hypothetical protein